MMTRRLVSSLCVLALLAGLAAAPTAVFADSDTSNSPGTVAQSYNAGPSVLAGMIVELKGKDQTTVVPAKSQDIRSMAGVVVPVNDANIVLTPPSVTTQQVLVAAAGRYQLLVSNQNGQIKAGDYLTISALDGIGAKAGSDQPEVIGRAVGNFDGSTNVLDTVSLQSSLGRSVTVAVGHIPVDVRLAPNPLFQNSNNLPGFLAKAANNIVHKPVSQLRIYLSVLVVLATLFIAGTMFYGGIRGGITAIGRNPLAKKAINRGLIQAILFGFIVFVIGTLAAYAILL